MKMYDPNSIKHGIINYLYEAPRQALQDEITKIANKNLEIQKIPKESFTYVLYQGRAINNFIVPRGIPLGYTSLVNELVPHYRILNQELTELRQEKELVSSFISQLFLICDSTVTMRKLLPRELDKFFGDSNTYLSDNPKPVNEKYVQMIKERILTNLLQRK